MDSKSCERRGNNRADAAAKLALSLLITNTKLLGHELISRDSKFCLDKWQDIWNCCEGNELHSIYSMATITESEGEFIQSFQVNVSHWALLLFWKKTMGD